MIRLRHRVRLRHLLAAMAGLAVLLFVGGATAQHPAHEIIQPSLAYLKLEYKVGEGHPAEGTPGGSQATGFLVSDDGFILTSYHLLDAMIADDGENQKIHASIGGPNGPTAEAAVVNGIRALDLLLLKVAPTPGVPFEPVRLGRAYRVPSTAHVFTTGFHENSNGRPETSKQDGTINSREGPLDAGYVWSVNLNVVSGRSGSPVYLEDGTVIGLVKGNNSTDDDLGYMIPLEFADGLVAHLRLAEINRKLDDLLSTIGPMTAEQRPIGDRLFAIEQSMIDVGRNFEWSAQYGAADGVIAVTYSKLIKGDPLIARIAYIISPFVKFKSGTTTKDHPLFEGTATVEQNPDLKGGLFRLASIKDALETRKQNVITAESIPELEIAIVTYLADDTILDRRTIRVETGQPR